jgi:hypothetical protein
VSSGRKTAYVSLLAAGIGLVTAVCGLLATIVDFPLPGPEPRPTERDPFDDCNPAAFDAQLQLSDGRGPSGTELTVRGASFCPEERVEIFFGTDTLQFAETETDGTFAVEVRIPGTLDFAAPIQVDIRARGNRGSFASNPFQLTTQ